MSQSYIFYHLSLKHGFNGATGILEEKPGSKGQWRLKTQTLLYGSSSRLMHDLQIMFAVQLQLTTI